jgi:chromosomal replication initiator protein
MSLASGDLNAVWSRVLGIVRGDLNEPSFRTWFEHTTPVELTDDGVFVVGVQNDFARSWLEERYSQRLGAALTQVVGIDVGVAIVVDENPDPASSPEEDAELAAMQAVVGEGPVPEASARNEFDAKCTFESYVVGASNALARNAALTVAEQPGSRYNPLFIWGGPGLGKTHLLQAIGSYVTTNYPHKKVMYVTSEQFTNDFVNSISDKTADAFRRKYRSVDVLLIDDIQFLQNKPGSQEQFFNTFNELHLRRKAVVLASDRPPKDIDMEERYTSRFKAGLQADIQPPDFETRLAILRQFVETQDCPFSDDALAFVAERSTPNIREMEGAVIRIVAYHNLTKNVTKKEFVDLEMAQQVTQDIFPDRSRRPIPVSLIQGHVCRFYNITHAEMISSKRSHNIVFPRQIAMYLARELTDLSLPKIGQEFGGRDHTTVLHACDKIRKLMSAQRDVFNQIQQLTNTIHQKV